MKTLDRGYEAIPWRSIGVRRAVSGRPVLELTCAAAALARRHGIAELSVRSHTGARLRRQWHWRRRGTMTESVNAQIRCPLSGCSASGRRRLAHRSDGPLVMVEPE